VKNFIAEGDVLTLALPYDRLAGEAFKVGSIVAVATSGGLSGASVEGIVVGVVEVAKVSAQAWTVGLAIYWDDSAKLFTSTSTSNTLAGIATAVAANPSATGKVRLNGRFG
jgi:predicted RecA/RadA family phage recombinase